MLSKRAQRSVESEIARLLKKKEWLLTDAVEAESLAKQLQEQIERLKALLES